MASLSIGASRRGDLSRTSRAVGAKVPTLGRARDTPKSWADGPHCGQLPRLPVGCRYRFPVATPRFLQLSDVAEILNCSASQVYALVRNDELPAVKIGGRGQWRVEASMLEDYIQRMYKQTNEWVKAHPYGGDDEGELS